MELLALVPFRIPLAAMALKQGMEIIRRVDTLTRGEQQLDLLIQFLLLDLLQQRKSALAIGIGRASQDQRRQQDER